ncbi:hypothetical protein [Zunongwangia sp.]|uniref:hypothetical protein n=1 Tax=Zunongwangia sp. TaxID=1965325 RepID=UPI003AA88C60
MRYLFKYASYVFHPVWMSFLGTLCYFILTPRYFLREIIEAKLLAITIITIFIPLVFFFLLKNLGKVSSFSLNKVKERKLPLLASCLLNYMVLQQVFDQYNYPEAYLFFEGILISSSIALVASIFKIKISLHMMGLSGLSCFLLGIGHYFDLNMVLPIAFLLVIIGLTASSRMYFKAHNKIELMLGILCGGLPQSLLFFLVIN